MAGAIIFEAKISAEITFTYMLRRRRGNNSVGMVRRRRGGPWHGIAASSVGRAFSNASHHGNPLLVAIAWRDGAGA